ncbi:thioredoxin-dependent thiol peroxidase [Phreatobacter stygius]|uniref:thioredoxin-dependent peroxiredoxin n=1 Tax=Phreatobacter stygius TaxID=1940610 RepID=A0A4D7BA37_9HYPH|nr:thioredoxin-dependent thiol peroxidase [Phreatobacter stygius]QCI67695.1 thioredoxin-dependent thiol peroxidase [Phreatobacter stygius]
MALSTGDLAPDFSLPADRGGTARLSELRGSKVVVYFYPKANTEACTVQAQDFTRLKADFDKAGTTVLGISHDPVKAIDKFQAKYDLGIKLATDEGLDTLDAYGVWGEKSMYGRKYMGIERTTFLVGPDGRIARIWPKVRVKGHAEEVLAAAIEL